jgi:hypothetical protein
LSEIGDFIIWKCFGSILKCFQDKILPLEEKAHLHRHIPNSLSVETFDRAEANFIQAFFGGDTKAYQDWRNKLNNNQ